MRWHIAFILAVSVPMAYGQSSKSGIASTRLDFVVNTSIFINHGQLEAEIGTTDEVRSAQPLGQEFGLGLHISTSENWWSSLSLVVNRLPFGMRYNFDPEANNLPYSISNSGIPLRFSSTAVGMKLQFGRSYQISEGLDLVGGLHMAGLMLPDFGYVTTGDFRNNDTLTTFTQGQYEQDRKLIFPFGCNVKIAYTPVKYSTFSLGLEGSLSLSERIAGTVDYLPNQPSYRRISYSNHGTYLGLSVSYRYRLIPWD